MRPFGDDTSQAARLAVASMTDSDCDCDADNVDSSKYVASRVQLPCS